MTQTIAPAVPAGTLGHNGHAGTRLRMPARAHIGQVDESDPLTYYYFPPTAWLYRQRLQLALDLLGPGPYESILEAGCGSGVLLPSLASRTGRLCAMDLHRRADLVGRMLRAEGVRANLAVGNVCDLAYADASFDAVVCISTLEHLHDDELRAAAAEITRVLRPGGVAVVGVPASGWAMDVLFRCIGFAEIDDHHVSGRREIERELRRHLDVDGEARLPAAAPRDLALYTVFRGVRRSGE